VDGASLCGGQLVCTALQGNHKCIKSVACMSDSYKHSAAASVKSCLQRHAIIVPLQDTHLYMDAARDCYEAFVIYNFFMYLLAYLEDEYGDIDAYFSTKEDIPHMWPVHYFQKPWAMGIDFFWQCKKGILNYVILRPLMSAVSLIANAFDSREAGNRGLDFRHPYVYTTIVNNFSQTWALYCLVLMFKATKDELSPIRPFAKFAVVKAVVFLSFWQSVLVQLVAWWKPSIFGGDVSLFCLLPMAFGWQWHTIFTSRPSCKQCYVLL
jgi:hypothetical protein